MKVAFAFVSDENGLMQRVFCCIYCDRSFHSRYQLRRHLPVHTGERRFVCGVCSMAFAQSSTLSRHKLTHKGEKSYACEECGQKFARSSGLVAHKKIHSGEKDHKCPICGKGFRQKGNLVNHINYHNGVRPYSCDLCNESFNQQSNLKEHMQRRHKEMPTFCCSLCQCRFSKRKELRKHETESHGDAISMRLQKKCKRKKSTSEVKVLHMPPLASFNTSMGLELLSAAAKLQQESQSLPTVLPDGSEQGIQSEQCGEYNQETLCPNSSSTSGIDTTSGLAGTSDVAEGIVSSENVEDRTQEISALQHVHSYSCSTTTVGLSETRTDSAYSEATGQENSIKPGTSHMMYETLELSDIQLTNPAVNSASDTFTTQQNASATSSGHIKNSLKKQTQNATDVPPQQQLGKSGSSKGTSRGLHDGSNGSHRKRKRKKTWKVKLAEEDGRVEDNCLTDPTLADWVNSDQLNLQSPNKKRNKKTLLEMPAIPAKDNQQETASSPSMSVCKEDQNNGLTAGTSTCKTSTCANHSKEDELELCQESPSIPVTSMVGQNSTADSNIRNSSFEPQGDGTRTEIISIRKLCEKSDGSVVGLWQMGDGLEKLVHVTAVKGANDNNVLAENEIMGGSRIMQGNVCSSCRSQLTSHNEITGGEALEGVNTKKHSQSCFTVDAKKLTPVLELSDSEAENHRLSCNRIRSIDNPVSSDLSDVRTTGSIVQNSEVNLPVGCFTSKECTTTTGLITGSVSSACLPSNVESSAVQTPIPNCDLTFDTATANSTYSNNTVASQLTQTVKTIATKSRPVEMHPLLNTADQHQEAGNSISATAVQKNEESQNSMGKVLLEVTKKVQTDTNRTSVVQQPEWIENIPSSGETSEASTASVPSVQDAEGDVPVSLSGKERGHEEKTEAKAKYQIQITDDRGQKMTVLFEPLRNTASDKGQQNTTGTSATKGDLEASNDLGDKANINNHPHTAGTTDGLSSPAPLQSSISAIMQAISSCLLQQSSVQDQSNSTQSKDTSGSGEDATVEDIIRNVQSCSKIVPLKEVDSGIQQQMPKQKKSTIRTLLATAKTTAAPLKLQKVASPSSEDMSVAAILSNVSQGGNEAIHRIHCVKDSLEAPAITSGASVPGSHNSRQPSTEWADQLSRKKRLYSMKRTRRDIVMHMYTPDSVHPKEFTIPSSQQDKNLSAHTLEGAPNENIRLDGEVTNRVQRMSASPSIMTQLNLRPSRSLGSHKKEAHIKSLIGNKPGTVATTKMAKIKDCSALSGLLKPNTVKSLLQSEALKKQNLSNQILPKDKNTARSKFQEKNSSASSGISMNVGKNKMMHKMASQSLEATTSAMATLVSLAEATQKQSLAPTAAVSSNPTVSVITTPASNHGLTSSNSCTMLPPTQIQAAVGDLAKSHVQTNAATQPAIQMTGISSGHDDTTTAQQVLLNLNQAQATNVPVVQLDSSSQIQNVLPENGLVQTAPQRSAPANLNANAHQEQVVATTSASATSVFCLLPLALYPSGN